MSNAGHVYNRLTYNGKGNIVFDIYPREQNHRYTPHITVLCGEETIRITISLEPYILGPAHFTGNNSKN